MTELFHLRVTFFEATTESASSALRVVRNEGDGAWMGISSSHSHLSDLGQSHDISSALMSCVATSGGLVTRLHAKGWRSLRAPGQPANMTPLESDRDNAGDN